MKGSPGISDRFEWFGIDYTGRFWIEEAGQYRFSLLSDDGARLRIDDKELIDNDGTHAASALSASAFLSRGVHTMRVAYYQGPGAPGAAWRIFNMDVRHAVRSKVKSAPGAKEYAPPHRFAALGSRDRAHFATRNTFDI